VRRRFEHTSHPIKSPPLPTQHRNAERKCADTAGTVLVPWAAAISNASRLHSLISPQNEIKYTKAILSNNTLKLLRFEITEMLIAL